MEKSPPLSLPAFFCRSLMDGGGSRQLGDHLQGMPARFIQRFLRNARDAVDAADGSSVVAPVSRQRDKTAWDRQAKAAATVEGGAGATAAPLLSNQQYTQLEAILPQWVALLQPSMQRQTEAGAPSARPSTRDAIESSRLPPLTAEEADDLFSFPHLPMIPAAWRSATQRRPCPYRPAAAARLRRAPAMDTPRDAVLSHAAATLSQYGPLWQSWCGVVLAALPCCDATADLPPPPCGSLSESENWRCRLGQQLEAMQDRWLSALSRETDSRLPDAHARDVGLPAFIAGWETVMAATATATTAGRASCSDSGEEDEGRDHGSSDGAVAMTVLATQLFYECCRLAAGGSDRLFAGVSAISLDLLRRIFAYLAHRLVEEVDRILQGCGRGVQQALSIGTLAVLALQSPMTVDLLPSGGQKSVGRRRRRRRGWESDDDDDDDDDDDMEGGPQMSSWTAPTTSEVLSRLGMQAYSFPLASAILTTYGAAARWWPDSRHGGERGRHRQCRLDGEASGFMVLDELKLVEEQYYRSGSMGWWTLGDSQRHRAMLLDSSSSSRSL